MLAQIEPLIDENRAATQEWNAQTIREILDLTPVDLSAFTDALARCVRRAHLPIPQVMLAASPLDAWRIFWQYKKPLPASEEATWAVSNGAVMAARRETASALAAMEFATISVVWMDATSNLPEAETMASATREATWAATHGAVMAAMREATNAAPRALSGGNFLFLSGGRERLNLIRSILFFQDRCRQRLFVDTWACAQDYYNLMRTAGSCILHGTSLVVVSQPPLRRDTYIENGRYVLHADGRAAVEYRDGFRLYYLHGVAMPKWVVETPATHLDVAKGMALTNAQQRAEFVRKVGIERVCEKMRATVLDRATVTIDGTAHPYEVLALPINGKTYKYLKMRNPSVGLYHIEGLAGNPTTVREALHVRKPEWMRRIPVSDDGLDWYQQGDVYIVPRGAKSLKPYPCRLT